MSTPDNLQPLPENLVLKEGFPLEAIEAGALEYLQHGREGFDIPHTQAVVYYAAYIAQQEKLDPHILITAAWFHDTGYFGQFEDQKPDQYQAVIDRKEAHMKIGAEYVTKFMDSEGISEHFEENEKVLIQHLVKIHDNLIYIRETQPCINIEGITPEQIKRYERALAQADTLGQIDVSRVTPTFNKQGLLEYIKGLKSKRVPLFYNEDGSPYFTSTGSIFNDLLETFTTYANNLPE